MWPILLYGVEIWTVSQRSKEWLEAFEMWTICRLLRISWTEWFSNERVLILAAAERELLHSIKKYKLQYFGHLMRHNSLQRDLLEGMVEEKIGRGRPRAKLSQNIQGWLEMEFVECKQKARNRKDCATTVNLRDGDDT